MKLKEFWVVIEGFPNYLVSNFGQVKNKKTGKILKQNTNSHGNYSQLRLCNNKGCFTKKVHKLVSLAFIGETPKGLEINHIDGVKTNNIPSNFEFVTHVQNQQHARYVLNKWMGGPKIRVTNVETGEVFDSITSAAKSIGTSQGSVSNVLKGRAKTAKGFHFELFRG